MNHDFEDAADWVWPRTRGRHELLAGGVNHFLDERSVLRTDVLFVGVSGPRVERAGAHAARLLARIAWLEHLLCHAVALGLFESGLVRLISLEQVRVEVILQSQ